MTENGVIAVKLFTPHLSHLMHRARAEFGAELSENELIEECFPNPRYVFLRRKDRICQAISFMRAMNTMEFERRTAYPVTSATPGADLDLSMEKISSYVETFTKQELQWRRLFKRNHIVAHEIVYEDLAADYQSTIFGALESLGITPSPGLRLPSPRTVRQSDDATEKMAARYAEYKARVQAEVVG
jgi:LPS sulfotransferase NodH